MRTKLLFADFNNFVAFGEFVSIDLRVNVREMISGKIVKKFSVNTKLPDYVLAKGLYSEVSEALFKCASDLVNMLVEAGFYRLADYVDSQFTFEAHCPEEEIKCKTNEFAALLKLVFALNHNLPNGGSFVSWEVCENPARK